MFEIQFEVNDNINFKQSMSNIEVFFILIISFDC